jgi:hypothetical protein
MSVLGLFAFWTLWYKERQSMYLQKILVVLPILKTLHTLIITANIGLCQD